MIKTFKVYYALAADLKKAAGSYVFKAPSKELARRMAADALNARFSGYVYKILRVVEEK